MLRKQVRTDLRMVGAAYLATSAAPLVSTLAVGGEITGALVLLALVAAILSTAVLWIVAIPTGRLLARVVWRHAGRRLQRQVLTIAARRVGARRIFLTGRPDQREKERIRVLETAAVVIGVEILGITLIRALLPIQATVGFGLALLAASFALTVILTPRWTFARLGIRLVRARSLVITPLAREYGSVTRAADGAFLLLAIGISTFLLRRLGATDAQAFIQVISIVVPIAGFVILVCSFALRHHARGAPEEDAALVAHAQALGCPDLRGASEDELARALIRAG